MSIVFYEEPLRRLLESREGPVGQFLEQTAQEATERARGRAQQILKTFPAEAVIDYRIEEDPLQALVGVFGFGTIARYLSAKEGRERWLSNAVQGV